ncbi:preQ(1) synthase [Roseimicrobium sp. ORNL1]|uniref:preQ(1) synthase n=1 Tax=Roseimicrobium sp. ORNL1 TaxID=2711231 RepID=UPI0013E19925|nr:preQ(1) synthase [Roseimicrobium sp. ORNL1]QIF00479.1 NADPH-dependent 7-cyano-7-deazaguanine reductase QueF [Roseimicrobium sp. ORNL1]
MAKDKGKDKKKDKSKAPAPAATKAAPLTLLGHSENRLPTSPDEATLEVFPNRTPGRNYRINLSAPEFSSLCPVTGQPDSAHLEIVYVPDKLCIETKSFKFYLASYRNFPAFNEVIVNRILDDLVKACAPKQMHIRGDFGARGGISLSCEAKFPDWPDEEEAICEGGCHHH